MDVLYTPLLQQKRGTTGFFFCAGDLQTNLVPVQYASMLKNSTSNLEADQRGSESAQARYETIVPQVWKQPQRINFAPVLEKTQMILNPKH